MFQGTPPFMAISLLMKGAEGVIHEARHDLESLFYVIIYCATMLKGPHQCWRVEDDFKSYTSVPLKDWFGLQGMERSYAHMGRVKMGHLEDFEGSIVGKMDKYFSPLFLGIQTLRDVAFPRAKDTYVNAQLDWKKMTDILNKILAGLPENHTRREAKPAAVEKVQGVKRKRGEFCTMRLD